MTVEQVFPQNLSIRSHADTLRAPVGIDGKTLLKILAVIAMVGTSLVLLNEANGTDDEVGVDDTKNEGIEKAKKDGCLNCGSKNLKLNEPFIKGAPFSPGIECLDCGWKITG